MYLYLPVYLLVVLITVSHFLRHMWCLFSFLHRTNHCKFKSLINDTTAGYCSLRTMKRQHDAALRANSLIFVLFLLEQWQILEKPLPSAGDGFLCRQQTKPDHDRDRWGRVLMNTVTILNSQYHNQSPAFQSCFRLAVSLFTCGFFWCKHLVAQVNRLTHRRHLFGARCD